MHCVFSYTFLGALAGYVTGAQEVGLRGCRFSTEADIERHISNGFGRGTGASYKPWLRVQDVPSTGHSRKVSGVKIERTFHLLSNLEYGYFLASEFSEDVVDIREQYPLLQICRCAEDGLPASEIASKLAVSLATVYR